MNFSKAPFERNEALLALVFPYRMWCATTRTRPGQEHDLTVMIMVLYGNENGGGAVGAGTRPPSPQAGCKFYDPLVGIVIALWL